MTAPFCRKRNKMDCLSDFQLKEKGREGRGRMHPCACVHEKERIPKFQLGSTVETLPQCNVYRNYDRVIDSVNIWNQFTNVIRYKTRLKLTVM